MSKNTISKKLFASAIALLLVVQNGIYAGEIISSDAYIASDELANEIDFSDYYGPTDSVEYTDDFDLSEWIDVSDEDVRRVQDSQNVYDSPDDFSLNIVEVDSSNGVYEPDVEDLLDEISLEENYVIDGYVRVEEGLIAYQDIAGEEAGIFTEPCIVYAESIMNNEWTDNDWVKLVFCCEDAGKLEAYSVYVTYENIKLLNEEERQDFSIGLQFELNPFYYKGILLPTVAFIKKGNDISVPAFLNPEEGKDFFEDEIVFEEISIDDDTETTNLEFDSVLETEDPIVDDIVNTSPDDEESDAATLNESDEIVNNYYSVSVGTLAATITKQPQNIFGRAGDTVTFSVEAEHAASYQWQYSKNGTDFFKSGVTGNKTDTITVNLTNTYVKYYWRCVITGEDGAEVVSEAATTIIPQAAAITEQPQNAMGKAGDVVTFSVEAEHAVSYQWQYSKNGTDFFKSGITGNKTDTITVNLTNTYVKYYWRCVITGEDGVEVVSDAATTIIPQAAIITVQPQNVKGKAGDVVTFSISAEHAEKYQWQYSKNGSDFFKSGVTGNKTDTITVNLTNTYVKYYWRCVITGEDGVEVVSDAATTIIPQAAVITVQPQNAKGKAGEVVTFSVAAEHAENYQWQYSKNGTDFFKSGVTGNKTDTITVNLTNTYVKYYWRCVITGEDGVEVVSDAATTVIPQAAVITVQPQNARGKVGNVVTFSVEAEHVESYQWQYSKNGTDFFKSGVTGNKTDTITVNLTNTYVKYYWRCVITGEDGVEVVSDAATTVIPQAAVITAQPQNARGKVGNVVTFSVEAEHAESYQWQYSKNGTDFFKSGVTGNKTDTISVNLTNTYAKYYWRCVITGEDGVEVISDAATTIILQAAVITEQPQNAKGKAGDVVTFSVEAEHAESYQWQYSKNGTDFFKSGITGNKTDTITVNLTSTYVKYYWRCVITGEDGVEVVSDAATTIIPQAAVITAQPQNARGKVGDVVTFSVEAEHAESYQWQYSKNGTDFFKSGIAGNKTNTITVNLTTTYVKYYWRCVITGEDGVEVVSDAATTDEPLIINDVVYEALTDTTCRVAYYMGNASSLSIPDIVNGMTVVEIGEEAFMGNTYLTSIDLPDTIVIIRARAFKNCSNLREMN